ncbi:hypothetical protein EVAR_32290_1 [Eumeta japonica]|uniref:Uncharacterized protein n=1 Tax=Eumeta variegata TaxID=151549 RepID=A0A4C1WFQ2_EUMVA|nr:hypothetical protein EVAR_32290_1 [Eumeta japonica]
MKCCVNAILLRRSRAAELLGGINEEGASVILHQSNLTQLNAKVIEGAGFQLKKVKHISIIGAPKLEYIEVQDLTKIPYLKSL